MRSMISSICLAVYIGILNLIPGMKERAQRRAFKAETFEAANCDYEPGTFLYLYKLAHSQSNWQTGASKRALFFLGRRRNLVSPSIIVGMVTG
jgi:hypothetical protein